MYVYIYIDICARVFAPYVFLGAHMGTWDEGDVIKFMGHFSGCFNFIQDSHGQRSSQKLRVHTQCFVFNCIKLYLNIYIF